MKRPLLLSLLLMLALVGRVWAQNRTVSGRVIDKSTNEGLPGVSVIVKGTTNGTATNADGQYSLAVPADAATLQFKYLGYVTVERPIGGSNTIDAGLDVDTKQLNEVVVTALGVPREKRALGYATSEIKSDQVVQKSEPDVLRAISGKVPGVAITSSSGIPGSSSRITIRGNSSLLGNNQPLFVVDGVPYDNSQTDSESSLVRGAGYSSRTADIDPNNIADIQILKGAAAAALYGSRAAGGVVVITTKTGSGQRGAKGVQIGYSTGYAFEKIAALPEYQNSYGNGANFTGPYVANGSWGPRFGSAQAPTVLPHPQAGNVNLGIPITATIPYQAYPNNVKDFFNTGHVFENSVSLTGTGDNATFSTIISRADNRGIIPNSFFTRNNVSAGGSGKFNKFTVSGSVGYTNSAQQGPQLGANNAVGNATAFARTLFLPRNLDLQGLPYIDPVTKQSYFAWLSANNPVDNPIWSTENNTYVSRVDRVTGSASLSYAFKDWLTLSYTGGINTYTDNRRTTVRPGSIGYGGVGNVLEDNIQNTELEQTLLLTFNKNLTEDISLRASIGQNINQRQQSWLAYQGSGIVVFGIDNIENTTDKNTNGYDYFKRRLMGVLGDLTIGYQDWAFVTATARNDWSSTLNKGGVVGQSGRSFFYPSISGSIVVNEALKLDAPWLSLAKARVAYARVGRDAPPYTAGPTRYIINPAFGNPSQKLGNEFPFDNGQTSTAVTGLGLYNSIGNPALTPEFTNELEVGTDLNFFKNRISISASYYDRRSTDQIATVSLPYSTGFGGLTTNFGEVSNKGFEVAFNAIPVDTRGFRWSSTANFTRNKNKVESLTAGLDQLSFGSGFLGGIQSILKPGQDYGVFYGTRAARYTAPDGKTYRLINPTDGRMIEDPNPTIIGNPNPKFLLSFINQFTYKNFTLNTLIDWRQGGDLYSTTIQSYLGRGVTKDTEDRERLVIMDGIIGDPTTRLPVLTDQNNPSSFVQNSTAISLNDYYFGVGSAAVNSVDEVSVYDATTIRLREITLGYDLPKNLLNKTPFGLINISLSARNLYWYSPNIPKYTNFDPETSTFGASNQQGFEYTNAPTTRRYGVNLRVNF
ncbi:SusC/RagA family TonB-linked outer membrane protein [Hymenobacter sp. ASUV-10]|uniref:SusC/RagA family TonB-linked outer membrane protein n=1 Tax=Hymenobacter aranciens TaxID=3063996 RepID=A0ABT9BED8_9BACT|nr:SusC/RagA family TonB-linked outer membrane protein [Hymenobacter sp. ASUV-10]MDO7876635.1 SusC/RagA family TonB-linked outer membrane protein [Hymenobacter sp. ASUV-10]